MEKIDQIIIDALKHPHDEALLATVVRIGQPAYDRLVSWMYPCPGPSHPQEVDDKMCEFVERIATLDPSVITNNTKHKDPSARSRVIRVAGSTGDPSFADAIIESLTDRSINVLEQAVWAIERHEYLRTARAAELLRKLLDSKRVNKLHKPRKEIEQLAVNIEKNQPNKSSEPTW